MINLNVLIIKILNAIKNTPAFNKLQIPQYLHMQEFEFGLSRNTKQA